MSKDLYFVRKIADALGAPEALEAAFAEINLLGQIPSYSRGHEQFRALMWHIRDAVENRTPAPNYLLSSLKELSSQAGIDLPECEGSADLAPWWLETNEGRIDSDNEEPIGSLLLVHNQRTIARIPVTLAGNIHLVTGALPGLYSLRCDSGCFIWERELSAQDLIWSLAFPGQAMEMVAHTDDRHERVTIEEKLLDGALLIRVFPGIRSGRVEIQVGTPASTER